MTSTTATIQPTEHEALGKAYSLNRPHPEHAPRVGREPRGRGAIAGSGMSYGTTLDCSCGWTPRTRTVTASDGTTRTVGVRSVSNEAPSSPGGRYDAQRAYLEHLAADVFGDVRGRIVSAHRSDKAAAKLAGALNGHHAELGGWVYADDAGTRPLCQGWAAYAQLWRPGRYVVGSASGGVWLVLDQAPEADDEPVEAVTITERPGAIAAAAARLDAQDEPQVPEADPLPDWSDEQLDEVEGIVRAAGELEGELVSYAGHEGDAAKVAQALQRRRTGVVAEPGPGAEQFTGGTVCRNCGEVILHERRSEHVAAWVHLHANLRAYAHACSSVPHSLGWLAVHEWSRRIHGAGDRHHAWAMLCATTLERQGPDAQLPPHPSRLRSTQASREATLRRLFTQARP